MSKNLNEDFGSITVLSARHESVFDKTCKQILKLSVFCFCDVIGAIKLEARKENHSTYNTCVYCN